MVRKSNKPSSSNCGKTPAKKNKTIQLERNDFIDKALYVAIRSVIPGIIDWLMAYIKQNNLFN